MRAETDSGFGSSYLKPTGLLQPNLLAGRYKDKKQSSIACWLTGECFSLDLNCGVSNTICRVRPQNDVLSNTDSEGSCSNVQTVQSVITTRQGWDGPKQSAVAVGVEQWVENTTNFSSLRLQGKLNPINLLSSFYPMNPNTCSKNSPMTWICSVIWATVNISSSDDISQSKQELNADH